MDFLMQYKWYFLSLVPSLITGTWILYLAIMTLIENKKEISPVAWVLAGPIVFVGLLFDVMLNLVVGTLLFIELPQLHKKEFLFTPRVARHMYTSKPGGYRETVAAFICSKLLDPFDPRGRHCNPPD